MGKNKKKIALMCFPPNNAIIDAPPLCVVRGEEQLEYLARLLCVVCVIGKDACRCSPPELYKQNAAI